LKKIIKNTTATAIVLQDVGVEVPPNGEYIIPPQEYLLWVDFILNSLDGTADVDLDTLIINGTLVVNDGILDLSPSTGIMYLQYIGGSDILIDNNNYNSNTLNGVLNEIASGSGSENFSYHTIPTDQVVHIRENEQMTVHGGHITIKGHLKISGELRMKQ